jgi:hypothetical protein
MYAAVEAAAEVEEAGAVEAPADVVLMPILTLFDVDAAADEAPVLAAASLGRKA